MLRLFACIAVPLTSALATPVITQSGLPPQDPPAVMSIETGGAKIGDERVRGRLRMFADYDIAIADPASRPVAVESPLTIELQGSSTVTLAKRSYDIELLDGDGQERDLPLAGLPAGTDWVLHGCGRDKTCLRNALVYSTVREAGRYAPRTAFVELLLDGEYQGLYVLTEKIRRHRDRVDLARPGADGEAGRITGGYIFKLDMGEGTPDDAVPRDWVSLVNPVIYSYHYPRHDRLTVRQKEYLHGHVAAFETMMRSNEWNHPETGYQSWLDVASWVDFALIQEFANNPDAYSKSVYLQKWPESRGNRIALGPVWDFDLAFGTVEFRDARRTDVWAHTANRFPGEGVRFDPPGRVSRVPQYWERLWADAAFHGALQCRWRELRGRTLALGTLSGRVDSWVEHLAAALERDGLRWRNPEPERYPGEVDALKDWIGNRLTWMDANLPGRCRQTSDLAELTDGMA